MTHRVTPAFALRMAIAIAGGTQDKFAKRIGAEQSCVCRWMQRGRIPAELAPTIERVTGGAVRCELLVPEVEWSVLRGNKQAGRPRKAS